MHSLNLLKTKHVTSTFILFIYKYIDDDVDAFIRKIRLCDYFDGEENNDVSLVRDKSNFTLPSGRNEILDTYASTTKTWCSIVSKENKKK